ncbi:unnamed protein product [Dibothriocephalus latus]|uniref:Vacuolar protein sorting-associated protein 51 homolog n=1 Tax=Dibothriocephalus latus TaxID=60516 RepID=A0A3P6SP04_DIBLA|nr:unnamed protein product [Dibothriocephalus latus]
MTSSNWSAPDPVLRFGGRTVFTRGRPPWYTCDGQQQQCFVIGICGGSGSGKTTVAQKIIERLNVSWVSLLSMDCYYKPTGLRGSQHASETGGGSSVKNLELDHTLAYQLRRLFFQRTDIFAPVEATRESILFGVIKIGLKAFVECARTRVFSKFGLHQIQVDCHFLHIHLWKFVSDEKQLQAVLEDVLSSVVQRCIEPELMDDSVRCCPFRVFLTSFSSGKLVISMPSLLGR